MKECEWRELYERTQYDDEELDDTELPVPPEPDPEELEQEQEDYPRPRRARWHLPLRYEFPRGTPSHSGSSDAAS
jgi:hypothetical protein